MGCISLRLQHFPLHYHHCDFDNCSLLEISLVGTAIPIGNLHHCKSPDHPCCCLHLTSLTRTSTKPSNTGEIIDKGIATGKLQEQQYSGLLFCLITATMTSLSHCLPISLARLLLVSNCSPAHYQEMHCHKGEQILKPKRFLRKKNLVSQCTTTVEVDTNSYFTQNLSFLGPDSQLVENRVPPAACTV